MPFAAPAVRRTWAAPPLVLAAIMAMVFGGSGAVVADESPLAPADTSSPRALLESFTATVDAIYRDLTHGQSTVEQRERIGRRIARVASCLDLSEVAPSLVESKRRQASVNLKEVLDRIALPPAGEIPDAEAVAADHLIRWRIPDTEIVLTRFSAGPRAGEWAFSTETVDRSEEFFRLVERLPYRADAGSPGLHDLYVESPGWMIPAALIRSLPQWARHRLWDVTLWQWAATGILLLVGGGAVAGGFAAARSVTGMPGIGPLAVALAAPLVLIGTCLGVDVLVTNQIRITGDALLLVKTALRVGMFGGCVVLVQAVLKRLGEAVIRSRRLRPGTIDTQLVRLGIRVLTVLAMAWMVILGADSLGISVAPVIAGLGVGGLAVALAAQHTVENFIAGLVLFADKPVRIGDACQFGEHRGTVEQIGLRSTRIRGIDRTVVSIPNAEFAKLRLVNLTRRDKILLKSTLGLRYETTADQLRHVLAALRHCLTTHPRIDAGSVRVRLIGYGAYSLDIEVYALAETNDWPTFLAIQEDILLEVMELVQASGCGFAFPSQTHYVAADTGVAAEVRQRAEAEVRDLRAAGGLTAAGFLDRGENAATLATVPAHRIHRPAA